MLTEPSWGRIEPWCDRSKGRVAFRNNGASIGSGDVMQREANSLRPSVKARQVCVEAKQHVFTIPATDTRLWRN
jgi:hypothetical protein